MKAMAGILLLKGITEPCSLEERDLANIQSAISPKRFGFLADSLRFVSLLSLSLFPNLGLLSL